MYDVTMIGKAMPRKNISVPVPAYEKLRRTAFKRKTKIARLIVEFAATL